jgi:hypothetical protein
MRKKILVIAFMSFVALVAVFIPSLAIGQDSTLVTSTPSGIPTSWLTYIGYALGVYELLIKVIPTTGNYSILSNVFKFLTWLIHANNTK